MYTKCPNCDTAFRVTEQQLHAAGGKVRCGRCATVFDANEQRLYGGEPTGKPEETVEREQQPDLFAQDFDEGPDEVEFDGGFEEMEPPVAPDDADSRAIPEILEQDLASLATQRPVWPAFAWGGAIVFLALLLALQYAYFMRADLAQYDVARPWLTRMCALMDCNIPLKKDLASIRLLSSDVLVHPETRNTLLVQTTFANTAAFPQPFPTLQIKLSNTRGETVAMRRFKPVEYLDEDINPETGMQPQVPVNLRMEVVKPEGEVSGYEFDFL